MVFRLGMVDPWILHQDESLWFASLFCQPPRATESGRNMCHHLVSSELEGACEGRAFDRPWSGRRCGRRSHSDRRQVAEAAGEGGECCGCKGDQDVSGTNPWTMGRLHRFFLQKLPHLSIESDQIKIHQDSIDMATSARPSGSFYMLVLLNQRKQSHAKSWHAMALIWSYKDDTWLWTAKNIAWQKDNIY